MPQLQRHKLVAAVGSLPGLTDASCPQFCLPSSNSAYLASTGSPAGLAQLGLHYTARSAIIGTGLYLGGFRGRELFWGSVLSGAMFELSILVWVAMEKAKNAQH